MQSKHEMGAATARYKSAYRHQVVKKISIYTKTNKKIKKKEKKSLVRNAGIKTLLAPASRNSSRFV